MSRWSFTDFEQVVDSRGSGARGLPKQEWTETGPYPVIGQGMGQIEGWTDRADLLVTPDPDLVIYGGHSRRAKHVSHPFVPGPNVRLLRTRPELYGRFLYHYLSQLSIESRGYADHFPEVRRHQVPLPPLDEQRRIAAILDAADAMRVKRRESVALLDDLLRSTFLDMFGDPVTNPKGWPLRSLEALGEVQTGTTPPSKLEGMFGGAIPFVTPGDLEETWIASNRTVTQAGAAKSRTVERGATLVCCIGATIGKMGKSSVRSAFNQQINAVAWGPCVEPDFGLESMRFLKRQIASDGASTTLPILKKSLFKRIEIPVPPMDAQAQFARAVQAIEGLRTQARHHLTELDRLFASLQHRAFRGEL